MGTLHATTLLRCARCGGILQCTDPNAEHFITPEVFNRKSLNDIVFCDNCYKASHYSDSPNKVHASKDLLTILKDARAADGLIVYFIDLFSFEMSIPLEVADVLEHQNILIIGRKRNMKIDKINKVDLNEYVAHEFRNYRIKVTRDDVFLTDFNSEEMKTIKGLIEERRQRHDVYLIGSEFSPVATYARKFLSDYINMSTMTVVTKKYPRTEMEVIRIPLDSSSVMYSVPAFPENNTFRSCGDETFKKIISPTSEFRARRRIVSLNNGLFIGGLVRIDLIDGKRTDIDVFVADKVDIEVQGGHHVERHFLEKITKKQIRPCLKEIEGIKDYDVFDVKIDQEGLRNIGFSGLGWISFKGNNQTFRIYVKRGIGVYGSRAKVDKNANTKK